MAGGIGRIARVLMQGAMARGRHRAMHRAGLGGWKGDLVRVLGNMASEAWRRRQQPGMPPAGPVPPAPPVPPRRRG